MRQTRRGFVALVGGASLAGCTGRLAGGTGSDGGDDPDPAVEEVSLLLNFRIGGLHAPYYVALEEGYFEEQGFESVEIESGRRP